MSRAHVGLALASALIVLLASGVAISRLGDDDDDRTSATAGGSTSSTAGVPPGASDSVAGSETQGTGSGAGAPAERAAGAADALATAPVEKSPVSKQGQRAPSASSAASATRPPVGQSEGDRSTASPPPAGSEPAGGSSAGGSGGQGGQPAPPQPSQTPPEQKPLLAASVSVGQGAEGGVVAVSLGDTAPEADVTLGTSPLIGDHPPSQGTGISLEGTIFQPSSGTFLVG